MNFLTDYQVELFINNSRNYDIRISHSARWIDQKCTPDVLTIVADCIITFLESAENKNITFTSQDIWHSDYAEQNVFQIFRKPGVNLKSAHAEYNKFFMQPMELLAYAGVLNRKKVKRQNVYSLANEDALYYISIRIRNAYNFLIFYITKVLKDSGLLNDFNNFFSNQTSTTFEALKNKYINFIITNTPINGRTETSRIFSKVINPLAYSHNAKGTEKGHISRVAIGYDSLMYNRLNFRDIYQEKPKDRSRQDHLILVGNRPASEEAYRTYLIEKAKREVRRYNRMHNAGMPEVEQYANGELGTQAHHIFPVHEFISIATYEENLICLNPSQHTNHAHPNGNTFAIDPRFQLVCLIAKTDTIEKDFRNGINFYSFDLFMVVLATGFNDDSFLSVKKNDFNRVKQMLMARYVS